MNDPGPTEPLFDTPPFRMMRLEVYNWGTFDGLHRIDISQEGFLFVGSSGSGKSTLLDAISALLVPPRWLDFNAAAREDERSRRDRNVVTYVRGAWSENSDADTGEVAKRYLRAGTTWSAIALRYANAVGETVTIAELFWLRGNGNAATDVRRHYLVAERNLPLAELAAFGNDGLDLRRLKAALPDVAHFGEFSNYRERFASRLGIEGEMALRLLHKTQSAKNLGDLNAFLREFMLDEPETFAVAERLVDEFGELKAAHDAVVTARRQIETLTPARAAYERLAELDLAIERYTAEIDALPMFVERLRLRLLETHRAALARERATREDEHRLAKRALEAARTTSVDLQARRHAAGGERLELLENDRARVQREAATVSVRRDEAAARCEALGLSLPDTSDAFVALIDEQRAIIDATAAERAAARERYGAASVALDRARQAFELARAEEEGLARRESNIPQRQIDLRERICAALGLDESALPFAGELMQVREDEATWRGAAERVLRPLALSLLVDERYHAAFADTVNGLHLAGRLTWLRADPGERQGTNDAAAHRRGGRTNSRGDAPDRDSLAHKIELRRGRWHDWLRHDLERRFDYTCTDDLARFTTLPRALTSRGLVRHGGARHEKDDRSSIDDRRGDVLGFDNREKRALLRAQLQDLGATLAEAQKTVAELDQEDDRSRADDERRKRLADTRWEDIDPAPLLVRARELEASIRAIRDGNAELAELDEALERARGEEGSLDEALRGATLALDRNQDATAKAAALIERTQARLDAQPSEPSPDALTSLDARVAAKGLPELGEIDTRWRELQADIDAERAAADTERERQQGTTLGAFRDFLRIWPGDSDGLDATLESATDFLSRLARLESDRLPEHEARFLKLLEDQSHQNLAALSSHLRDARRAIHDRLDLVNEGLARVPFNRDGDLETFLSIEPSDRHLPDVVEFRGSLKGVLENTYTGDATLAERRFADLEALVGRLASQETADKRWRALVLDVRLHVDFVGRERDAHDNEVEVYRSGAGKSGGQRQKLATTCLAAALRYQLGGGDGGAPTYSTVVLDEAFDKADNAFTDLAMRIFREFGFQMVVATPMKSVMTLEPHIGGACFVDIRDRRHSSALVIDYDAEAQRLKLGDMDASRGVDGTGAHARSATSAPTASR